MKRLRLLFMIQPETELNQVASIQIVMHVTHGTKERI